jgi:hypothetical protein
MKTLYYNPAGATGDPRAGMGYGKSQKIPSAGTGLGSTRSTMASFPYVEEDEYAFDEEESEEDFELDFPDSERFNKKVMMKYSDPDPSFWPRADRSSLGQSGNSSAIAALALTEQMPKAMSGMVPFSAKTLYPNGFSGPPIGTGNAGQAFRTTGTYKRTGTQYGTSRAPLNTDDETDSKVLYFDDIVKMTPDQRSILKQRIKILRLLNYIDGLE